MKFLNRYSHTDRLLHHLAFSSGPLQLSLADLEDRFYKKQIASVKIERPVLITALPRAGTTVLLDLLFQTGEFVSHTYREMPFILLPLLWQRLSRTLRDRDHQDMERAHGDGMTISVESAEAFEEIIWRQFWPQNYQSDRIERWARCDDGEFVTFMNNHLRKLIWLKSGNCKQQLRYVSKNNLNVARLENISSVFKNSIIVVPFREPLQHAASLLNQHLSFVEMHRNDPFARTYMRGVGHCDFGDNFLPINFDNWLNGDRRTDALQLSFWIEYWIATYRHVLTKLGNSCYLLPYDRLTRNPQTGLARLADIIGLKKPTALTSQSGTLREAMVHEADTAAVPIPLLEEASELFKQLNAVASFYS